MRKSLEQALAVLAIGLGCLAGCLDTSPDGKTFRCDPASGADCRSSGSTSGNTAASASTTSPISPGTNSSTTTAGSTSASATTTAGAGSSSGSTSTSGSTTSAAGSTVATSASGSTGGTGSTASSSTGTSGSTGYTSVEVVGSVPSGALIDVDVLDDGTLLGLAGNQIFSFDSTGAAHVYAGQPVGGDVDGPRLQAKLYGPGGLTHKGPVIYVSEVQSNLIRVIDASGNVGPYAGSGSAGSADGAASLASFTSPEGMSIDGAGDLLVADDDNHRVRKVVASGPSVQTVAGTSQGYTEGSAIGAAQFNFPRAVAAGPGGAVYVADSENHCVRVVQGGNVSTLGQMLGRPFGVAVDAAGDVYATDIDNAAIYRFDRSGTRLLVIQGGAVANPRGIKVDGQGRLVVANTGNNNVLRITLP